MDGLATVERVLMSTPVVIDNRRPIKPLDFKDTLQSYGYVLYALVLHDIKSRFFGSGLGQIVMILWPFIHIIVLLAIYTFIGRPTPYGTSLVLYSCTGIIPFIIFSYMSRWIVLSAMVNRSFLHYPIIKPLDLLIARAILEAVNIFVVTLLLIACLIVGGIDPWPSDTLQAFCAYGGAVFLAFSLGVFNGVITSVIPLWNIVFTLVIIVTYASSGILFVPSDLPEKIRDIAGYNPVLQCVEWMRHAYYADYPTYVLDRGYLLRFSLVALFLGLLLERLLRRFTAR